MLTCAHVWLPKTVILNHPLSFKLTFEQQFDTILAGRLTQDVLGIRANSTPLRLEMHDITSR